MLTTFSIFLIIIGQTIAASGRRWLFVLFHQVLFNRSAGLKLTSTQMVHHSHADAVTDHVGYSPQSISISQLKDIAIVDISWKHMQAAVTYEKCVNVLTTIVLA